MEKQSYFTIAELAKEFNVKKNHIRSYETKGLVSPRNNKLGRRIYNQFDRARLGIIFHLEHIGYSPDQMIELIGAPDVDLYVVEQIRKSLEYCEKKLYELVKRCGDLQVHQRTNIITDINMLREYVEELKTISPETKKKPERRPIRMIPIYVAGLALALIIAGYFYYQIDINETKTLYFAQNEQPKAKTRPVYRDSVPSNDTGDQKSITPQPFETTAPPLLIQQNSLTEESKELVEKEPVVKVEEGRQLEILALAKSVSKEIPSVPEQQKTDSPEDEQTVSAGVKEITITEKPVVDDMSQIGDGNKKIISVVQDSQKSHKTISELQQKKPNVAQLTRVAFASDEEKQTDHKTLSLSHVEKTKLDIDQDRLQPDNYTVYLYYANEENKELIEKLAISLKNKGFGVLGIEKVDYKNSDIRYFHSWDKAGALLLQKYSTEFITPHTNLKDTNIRIKDLSQEYPNARKGALELWANL